MPSTYTKLHYHIVFSTRMREPWIRDTWEDRLHMFLGGCLRNAGCQPLVIGGYLDHVHILTGMRSNHRVCDVVCDIKSGSSKWVHDTLGLKLFQWQEGYGAFTTSVKEDSELRDYIRNQKEHHRGTAFIDEFRSLLDEAHVEWDAKYLR